MTTDTAVIRWMTIPIRWICTGWIPSDWWAMQGNFKSSVAVYHYKRDAKGVQRNITAWITTDSIKIFSFTFCTLFTVYCTCKIAEDAFRIVLYFKTFYMLHCAVARFVLKQWFVYDCTYFVAEMYNVVCYWKTVSLYCELKCSLKTSVSLVLATEHLKL